MKIHRRGMLCSVLATGVIATIAGGEAMAGATQMTTVRVASGLARPVYVTHAPGDMTRVFIVEQRSGSVGRIRVLDISQDPPVLLATPFLSISGVATGSEQGLLGLAFHPNYQSNGYFYVNYTSSAGTTFVRRYTVSGSPATSNVADAGSAFTILTITQPFANHNGGWLGFGPDGYLYIPTGDGGSACDPGQRAQAITGQSLGKVLRLDVNGGSPYAIPPTNPFVGITGDDEIWAYGLRNPWRCAFDSLTGDLYIADVGQGGREELNVQLAADGTLPGSPTYRGGRNYGWDCMEGNSCVSVSGCAAGPCTCGSPSLAGPVHEYVYGVSGRCTIIGGEVYRGLAMPAMHGLYFYADYCSNEIWSLRYSGGSVSEVTSRTSELAPGGGLSITSISSFGRDAAGEIYICDLNGGEVFKIKPAVVAPSNDTCSTATLVSLGSHALTTVNATNSAQTETCGSLNSDVWYRTIIGQNCTLTASVCDANFDTQIAIYGVSCPSGNNTALACNDNSCGTGSSVSLAVTPGTYRIRVGSANASQGTGTLVLDCTVPPPTGACCYSGGSCADNLVQSDCENGGGVYQGNNVLCANVSCPLPCPADIMPPGGDGHVTLSDINAVLSAFGPCAGCPADIMPPGGDGHVTLADINAVLSAFGPCP